MEELNNGNRYFLVAYTAGTDSASFTVGNATYMTRNRKFVNSNEIARVFMGKNGFKSFVITSIIELSEADFNDFTENLKQ